MIKLNKYFPHKLQLNHVLDLTFFGFLNSNNDFQLIDPNFVGVMRFYKDKVNSYKPIDYMFIEKGIIMRIHGGNPPLMKIRKKNCY